MNTGIKVKGHKGTWYVAETVTIERRNYRLLEHETYREDAPWVAIDEDGEIVLEDIYNGVEDLKEHLEDEESKIWNLQVM